MDNDINFQEFFRKKLSKKTLEYKYLTDRILVNKNLKQNLQVKAD